MGFFFFLTFQNTENKVTFIHSALIYWPIHVWEGEEEQGIFLGELLAAFLMDTNILFPLVSMDMHTVHVYLSCQENLINFILYFRSLLKQRE